MPTANISAVSATFGNGTKREEYGPVKKAEVTIHATVGEGEDGTVVLAYISHMAMAKVADMLSAPRPDTVSSASIEAANNAEPAANEPPARRGRGPNKPKGTVEHLPPQEPEVPAVDQVKPEEPKSEAEAVYDEWAAGEEDIVITDAEILSATSKRAGELGVREPIVKLIASFATRTEGAPFKVQEIPANQRKDYLAKLAALTA